MRRVLPWIDRRRSAAVVVFARKRSSYQWTITLSVVLMGLNVTLMVCWIVIFAQTRSWNALTIGTIAFVLTLVGLTFYMILTIKEIRLNRRQANFVDSVTHELKTPIASLKLYLETLALRSLSDEQRHEFYDVMNAELGRLDHLINHLLEVGRLDAIGQQSAAEDIELEPMLRRLAVGACAYHKCDPEVVVRFDVEPAVIHARRMVLEMIFNNLLDNAVKYGGDEPRVDVEVRVRNRGRVVTRIRDNGEGVPSEIRKKIFRIFYRGGDELERRRKGTGLGLYIVRTLVHFLKGRITVSDRVDGSGSVFEVDLPGRADAMSKAASANGAAKGPAAAGPLEDFARTETIARPKEATGKTNEERAAVDRTIP
ncbi:MAG: HAMP domain-containing histidine kinase [Planctomycetes bacterium]|nr:HAMP domain-containing histidine kinase [Planctomycetota bacterium]